MTSTMHWKRNGPDRQEAAASPSSDRHTVPSPPTAREMLQIIEHIHELPTLAKVSNRLNKMFKNIDTPAQDLADLIGNDQSIVAKILKLVNSSFFGFRPKVTNMRHAIMLMGYNTVLNAILSISVVDALKLAKKFKGFDISSFWEHAIGVGTISRYLDHTMGDRFKEDSFTAGLVHDIGKIIMANFFPDAFAALLQKMDRDNLTFNQAEKSIFPIGHDQVGAHVVQVLEPAGKHAGGHCVPPQTGRENGR